MFVLNDPTDIDWFPKLDMAIPKLFVIESLLISKIAEFLACDTPWIFTGTVWMGMSERNCPYAAVIKVSVNIVMIFIFNMYATKLQQEINCFTIYRLGSVIYDATTQAHFTIIEYDGLTWCNCKLRLGKLNIAWSII